MARTSLRAAVGVVAVVIVLGATATLNVPRFIAPAIDESANADTQANEPVAPRDPVLEWAQLYLAEMSAQDKVRSLLMFHIPGLDVNALRSAVAPLADGGQGLGGVILMSDNVPDSPAELAALTAGATADPELPPIFAMDEEGGDVSRLPYDDIASASTLRSADVAATDTAFSSRAAILESVGVNLNFGIVADVTSSPSSFIYWRTFGDEPTSAAERVTAAVSAESAKVGSTLKHFPGHGRSGADSHSGIPTTDVSFDEWRATDAIPFEAGIDAGAQAVMFGHLSYSAVDPAPASLSASWHDTLRDDLGFDGLAVTDDMLMLQDSGIPELEDPYANAVAAVKAGNDVLLYVMPTDPSTVGIDVSTLVGSIVTSVDEERIDEAAMRVLVFRRGLAADALTWVPPCDTSCLATAVGTGIRGFDPSRPMLISAQQ